MAKTSQELAAAVAGITTENMGEKVRVHALAKTLGIASAEMVEVLNGQGIEGKRATSTLPKAQVAEVLDAIRTAGAPAEPEKPVKKAPAKKRAAAKKAEPKKAEPKKASATKTAAKKAPAKKKATGKATASATPEAPAVETTASEDAVVADVPRSDATVEQAAPKRTAAKKAAPKKAAPKKTAAKKAEPKQAAPTEDAPAEITPVVELITEEQTEQPVEQPVAKSTSRRRRGRKASGQTSGQTTEQPAPQPELTAVADTTDKAGTTEQAEVTVDALIDRIVESVETPAPVDAPADAPADAPVDAPADAPVAAAPAVADDAPRKVRRRVVRRVGSRSAASDAELLRTRKEEQRRVAEAAEAADANAATAAAEPTGSASGAADDITSDAASSTDTTDSQNESRSRRRGRRGRGRGRGDQDQSLRAEGQDAPSDAAVSDIAASTPENRETPAPAASTEPAPAGLPVLTEGAELVDEPVKLKGSTRLESKRRWRQEQGNEKRKVISKAEFLARRENVHRAMVVRDSERSDHPGTTTQVGITEDGMLVEHFVTSETQSSIIGNIYLGRVQNVLSSMEAAFIDIGTGRNAVLYAGEVDWKSKHLHTRTRRIEAALKPGDQVLVQAIKDPLGHKGARLTNRLSFAGRYLVYVPGGRTQGISRKLPEAERKRLKEILGRVVPENGGTIIRTAAEGVDEDLIAEDVQRLHQRWLDIQTAEDKARERSGSHPVTMYEEPNMLVKVIRDIFNEDFDELVVDGGKSWSVVRDYVHRMAPDLESRVVRYRPEEHGGADVFADRQLDEQLAKALSRKVWLPSGGYLIIDRTEAMTVIDVNTGSFVGSGGNLEETVTLNNLEAAEEIVRQMRLRDMGGMIVVDFIDMVLPENRDLMLRRLSEFLGRDRTRHKVSEVTSLGLVQMTRKRLGTGLLETFSTECPTCGGRGVIIHDDPVEHVEDEDDHRNHQHDQQGGSERRDHGNRAEKRQARQQQETRRRHEQAREIDRQAATAAAAVAEDPEQSGDAAAAPDASAGAQGGSSATVKGRTRRSRRGSRAGAGQQSAERRQVPDQTPDRTTQQVSAPTDRAETSAAQQSAPGQRTPEQAGEPGARRGRRRVVRRVEHPATDDSAGAGAGAGDVAAIAAQAVARAGAEDPDEPSGADYVADEPQVEKVVASAPESAPESATDRRGRRRVRRVVRPAAQRAEATTTDSGRADAPTEVPAEAPAEVPSEAPSVPSPQSYAEAKAEFDASPRRRRQTRGRSRSDVAPVPEDFTGKDAAPVAAPVAAVTTAAEPVARAQKPANTPVTGADSAPRRGRRKVVRSAR